MNKEIFEVSEEAVGMRLDKYIATKMADITRSHIQKWIVEGLVEVNGVVKKSNYRLSQGDNLQVTVPEIKEVEITPTKMDLDIVFEDDDLLIVNKPVNMVVHPAPGHYDDTLVNGVMYHCKDQLSGINGEQRPGIVHRIDKDTTGLLVVCKNDFSHVHLAAQLKAHTIDRVYEAIVYNSIQEDEGTVEGPIGRHPHRRKEMAVNYKSGRDAKTHFKVLARLKNGFTHVELKLDTGRTHQIRVHMAKIGHPLLGDTLYGPKNSPFNLPGQMLHARTLGFIHPRTEAYISFTVDPPEIFKKALERLQP